VPLFNSTAKLQSIIHQKLITVTALNYHLNFFLPAGTRLSLKKD